MKKIFNFVLLSAVAFMLLGCPSPNAPEDPVNYTVTYSTDHGTAPEPITVEEDSVLTTEQLKAITAEGYIFKGWFDGETEAKADEYVVTKDVELTAKWEVVPPTKYTVTYKTANGTAPEAISVEENTILTAEQLKALTFAGFIFKGWFDGETEVKAGEYKVAEDVTLTAKWEKVVFTGSEIFPFELGKVYSQIDGDGVTYSFVFNSDGTAKYEVLYENELLEGYEYNYSVNTDTKAIYCNVEKWFFGGFDGVFSKWLTLNEFADNYNNFLDENKLKAGILQNSYLREEIIDMAVSMEFGFDPKPEDAEKIKKYIDEITDDLLWETFKSVYSSMLNGMAINEMFEKQKPHKENECKNIFATIQKYEYEVDDTTGEPKSIKRVVYEEATLKDMISPTSTGEVNWQGNGDIDSIYIGGEFCYFLKGKKTTPTYPISEIKDGFIYIDNTFGISEECEKNKYKIEIDPIPYTESGKGENLVVTITFEVNQYELKYHEKTTVIEFN